VWTKRVVFIEPVIDHDTRLSQRTERPAVQTGHSKDGIEALVVSVLPRTARLDVVGIDLAFLQPSLDFR